MAPSTETSLATLVRCKACGKPLAFSGEKTRLCCGLENGSVFRRGFLIHDPNPGKPPPAEMLVRDRDAFNYLRHRKFPTQVDRFKRLLRARMASHGPGKVLDLGCGPGPTTALLLEAGFDAVAVDFSIQCLLANAQSCAGKPGGALFVQGDLNAMAFSDGAADGLMMADFLQHLGSKEAQRAFLAEIFKALKPGGWFYLSFFNTSLIDRLKGDFEGVRGNIPFRRLTLGEVSGMLPDCAAVERKYVTNVFNGAGLDRIASRLPFASLFASMAVIEGVRK